MTLSMRNGQRTLGIEQGKKWRACTTSEFRKFVNLKEFESFSISGIPIPLLLGLASASTDMSTISSSTPASNAKLPSPTGPGFWLPTGHTMMKAVCGDSFYTSSFPPSTLTAWGCQDIKREPNNGGLGGAFPKLLTRDLHRYCTFVSFWCSDSYYM
jgi:linoleate 10R-lipoxygenase